MRRKTDDNDVEHDPVKIKANIEQREKERMVKEEKRLRVKEADRKRRLHRCARKDAKRAVSQHAKHGVTTADENGTLRVANEPQGDGDIAREKDADGTDGAQDKHDAFAVTTIFSLDEDVSALIMFNYDH